MLLNQWSVLNTNYKINIKMKKVVISILVIFLFTSCEKEFYGYDEMGNKKTSKSTSTSTSSCSGKRTTSVQCSGTTQKGKRCGNMTLNCSGRCHLH